MTQKKAQKREIEMSSMLRERSRVARVHSLKYARITHAVRTGGARKRERAEENGSCRRSDRAAALARLLGIIAGAERRRGGSCDRCSS